jgi:hypothetical protein
MGGPSAVAGSSAAGATSSRRVSGRGDDEGLMMREKGDEGSIGRAGGVDVGVTRPKRRLSRFVWFLCFGSFESRGAMWEFGYCGRSVSRKAVWTGFTSVGAIGVSQRRDRQQFRPACCPDRPFQVHILTPQPALSATPIPRFPVHVAILASCLARSDARDICRSCAAHPSTGIPTERNLETV